MNEETIERIMIKRLLDVFPSVRACLEEKEEEEEEEEEEEDDDDDDEEMVGESLKGRERDWVTQSRVGPEM